VDQTKCRVMMNSRIFSGSASVFMIAAGIDGALLSGNDDFQVKPMK
jgi:hypothetical protein